MTALDDILAAIKSKRAQPRSSWQGTQRLVVRVGDAAAKSLIIGVRALEMEQGKSDAELSTQLPIMVDGCAIQTTDEFKGWEVVEL